MRGFASLPVLSWLALILGGLLSLLCNSGWLNPSVVPELSLLEEEMGPLRRNYTIEVDAKELGDLPPEAWTFQSLAGPDGQEGRLYVAYYTRGRRWSGRPHDVDVCYRSMGYEEKSAHQVETDSGAVFWSRVFVREGETKRVVHWLQKPGRTPGTDGFLDMFTRIGTPDGLRQDIASVYIEFDLADAPPEAELVEAAEAVVAKLENLWK